MRAEYKDDLESSEPAAGSTAGYRSTNSDSLAPDLTGALPMEDVLREKQPQSPAGKHPARKSRLLSRPLRLSRMENDL
jgi:hypothetical protein